MKTSPLTVQEVFNQLTQEWKTNLSPLSSMEKLAMHPAYQKIIGLGPDVLPHLFRELEKSPDLWFWALRSITRENPVQPEHRRQVKLMAKDWLDWAKKNGYAW